MPVVGEGIADLEPSHDCEGNVINDASLSGISSLKGNPCVVYLGVRRLDKLPAASQHVPEVADLLTKWCLAAALPHSSSTSDVVNSGLRRARRL